MRDSSKKKKILSDETLLHFKWELISNYSTAQRLFNDYQMSGARNKEVNRARIRALDVILSNISRGSSLLVSSFAKIKKENNGFGRKVFLDVLNHLCKVALIGREGDGDARSIIHYSSRIRKYMPVKVIVQPLEAVVINDKRGSNSMAKVNTEERRRLKNQLKEVWAFYGKNNIETGVDDITFNLFNELQVEVHRGEPLVKPDPSKILPYIVFSDPDLTKGGRMYGAFWIGVKKLLRRPIRINGELTADLDGKAMHVQLIYKLCGKEIPDGDPYLFTGEKRKIAKNLMLLMMNTYKHYSLEDGRKAVKRAYTRHFSKHDDVEELILELESFHHNIATELYRPNWGNLQRTEGALMLSIMRQGISDNVVILPVHDGCLCQISNRDKVLSYFQERDILAVENPDHLKPLPIQEATELLKQHRIYARCA